MSCANPECVSEQVLARGYCEACYNRWKRRGTVTRAYQKRGGTCSVDGCDLMVMAKGMCSRHYQQARPGKSVWKVLRSNHKGDYPPAWDDFEVFVADVGARPSEKHQLRRLDASKPWSAANCEWREPVRVNGKTGLTANMADYQRAWSYLRKFGLTEDDITRMRDDQDGKCPICTRELGYTHPDTGKPVRICVDHDHKTGEVRGLLCDWCNKMLGHAEDVIDRLRAAIVYLQRHQSKAPVPEPDFEDVA